ncbi:asparagine synthase (glutamine-hydrolyzing) [Candidatus Woesearchaeota archaeon]|nr:asparagine synthase (glutamine-hydrolyzing) [Candidatus Woesearchaeota archaeon]
MCGITGFNWNDKNLVQLMNKAQNHRGPDDKGVYTDTRCSLGHVRLSIIDLSKKGHQPMEYKFKGKKAVIIFNGEVYNFQEIRQELENKGHKFNSNTDTEVILASYLEWGENCVNYFNGMWSFCIYDEEKKILFFSRDRLGVKPLHYFYDGSRFAFASEIKSLLIIPGMRKTINLQSLNGFFTMRYCFGNETIFEGIKKLQPGHNLIFNLTNKKLTITKYWSNNTNNKLTTNKEFIHNKIIELMKDSIKKRLIADVPVGVFLSGGIDSSAIVALMREADKDTEIKTYALAFEEGEKVNELPRANKIAKKFNTKHTEFLIGPDTVDVLSKLLWHLDEPMADPAIIPLYFLAKNSRSHVKTVITGDGGDEVFGGYDYYKIFNHLNTISKIPFSKNICSSLLKVAPNFLLKKIHKNSSDMDRNAIIRRINYVLNNIKNKNYFKAYTSLVGIIADNERKKLLKEEYFEELPEEFNQYFIRPNNLLNKFLYYDQNVLLPDSYLNKTDRMTMAVGLEAREPLLDYRLLEFSYRIPPKYKVSLGQTKYIFRTAMKGRLPKDLLWRQKQGFQVPVENWIKNMLDEQRSSILQNKQVNKFFNKTELEKIFDNYKKGEIFYTRQVWNLICFNLWHKKVMEE